MAAIGLFLALAAEPVRAQSPNPCIRAGSELRCLESQLFLPTVAAGTTFTIDTPAVPRHMTFVLGLGSSFALAPLSRIHDDGEAQAVLPYLWQSELMLGLGLFEVLELGVVAPMVVGRVAEDVRLADFTYGGVLAPGDLRLSAKMPIVRGQLSLSARTVATLPTGDDGNFLSTGYWTLTPSAVAAYVEGPLTVGAELGLRMRRRSSLGDLELDDELQVAAGARYRLGEAFALIGELDQRLGVGGRRIGSDENPLEVDLGGRLFPATGITVDVGGGTSLLRGYGSPQARAFAILRYATEREPCPGGPEDFDGFEDGDFCADLDNDADGLPDAIDQCVNDAEDRDGFLDDDGCPDLDNDGDGRPDADDACPLESEDVDGYADEDGCPDRDNDDDGLPDGWDRCPMEPEDRDEFEDEDGCPEPGPQQATVTVTETRILISERIYFDFDRDTIRSVSMPLLDQVAQAIGDLQATRRIRVEGYTDDAGVERYNVDLSYRRARAVVEYLAGRGVARARLDYVGYGSRNPVAPNDSLEGRALNRRVEFTILDPSSPPAHGRRRRRGTSTSRPSTSAP